MQTLCTLQVAMSRIPAALLLALAALSLAGCGMKGPLELPPAPAPTPLLGKPKTAPAKAGAPDVSTPTRPPAGTTNSPTQ